MNSTQNLEIWGVLTHVGRVGGGVVPKDWSDNKSIFPNGGKCNDYTQRSIMNPCPCLGGGVQNLGRANVCWSRLNTPSDMMKFGRIAIYNNYLKSSYNISWKDGFDTNMPSHDVGDKLVNLYTSSYDDGRGLTPRSLKFNFYNESDNHLLIDTAGFKSISVQHRASDVCSVQHRASDVWSPAVTTTLAANTDWRGKQYLYEISKLGECYQNKTFKFTLKYKGRTDNDYLISIFYLQLQLSEVVSQRNMYTLNGTFSYKELVPRPTTLPYSPMPRWPITEWKYQTYFVRLYVNYDFGTIKVPPGQKISQLGEHETDAWGITDVMLTGKINWIDIKWNTAAVPFTISQPLSIILGVGVRPPRTLPTPWAIDMSSPSPSCFQRKCQKPKPKDTRTGCDKWLPYTCPSE